MKDFQCGVGFIFLCSFASDVANRYSGSLRYPARDCNEGEALVENSDKPFEIIADFRARGASPKNMRKHATKIDADAVTIQTLGGRLIWTSTAGEDSESKS